jgi:hypothetical protein
VTEHRSKVPSLEDPVCGRGLTCGDADLRLSCQVSTSPRGFPLCTSGSGTHRARLSDEPPTPSPRSKVTGRVSFAGHDPPDEKAVGAPRKDALSMGLLQSAVSSAS